jgi:hypothetical protein
MMTLEDTSFNLASTVEPAHAASAIDCTGFAVHIEALRRRRAA